MILSLWITGKSRYSALKMKTTQYFFFCEENPRKPQTRQNSFSETEDLLSSVSSSQDHLFSVHEDLSSQYTVQVPFASYYMICFSLEAWLTFLSLECQPGFIQISSFVAVTVCSKCTLCYTNVFISCYEKLIMVMIILLFILIY